MVLLAIFVAKLLSPIAAIAGIAGGYFLRRMWMMGALALGVAVLEEMLLASTQRTRQFDPLVFLIGLAAVASWIWVGTWLNRWRSRASRPVGTGTAQFAAPETEEHAAGPWTQTPGAKVAQSDRLLHEMVDPRSKLYADLAEFRLPDSDRKRAVLEQAIAAGKLLGADSPRIAFEMLMGRPSSDEEWEKHREPWELLWPYVKPADVEGP